MATFYNLTIQKIIKETADAVSLIFDVPAALKETFSFRAGQYLTLKKEIDGAEVRRAYSICASPNSNELKVAIKAVENGTFSTYATTKLHEGDLLEVAPPEGKFIIDPQANNKYIGFAAGSGITPVLAMIKQVLEDQPSASFTLVYGNKTAQTTIFKGELDALATRYASQFNLHYLYSREAENGAALGRIDEAHTLHVVKDLHSSSSFDAAFLCGPEAMINTVSDTLKDHGFNKENIHFELFTASTEAVELDIPEGKTQITVLLDDEETSFTMDKTDDLLAASLRNDLDAPYSCQGGVCSSCLGKVTEGKAVMSKNSILSDDEVEEGFVLTCQAYPATSKLVLDFDDV